MTKKRFEMVRDLSGRSDLVIFVLVIVRSWIMVVFAVEMALQSLFDRDGCE